MSQITTAPVILDGQATPVAKTFNPEGISPSLSTFVERSAGSVAGYLRSMFGFSPATSQRKTTRVTFDFSYPVLSTVNGVSTVAYTGLFKGYFVIPDQMTAAERANLRAYVANWMDNAAVIAMIKDAEPMW